MSLQQEKKPNALKKGTDKVKEKCTDKVLKAGNFLAYVLFTIGGILRFIWCFSSAGYNFFFMINSFYYIFFCVILVLAEVSDTNKFSIMVKTYFNFLDRTFGKGLFIIFQSMMLVEVGDAGEIVLALVCIVIGVCNLIIGWSEANKELPSVPWKQIEVGKQMAQGAMKGVGGADRSNKYEMQGAMAGMAVGAAVSGAANQFNQDNQQRPSNVPMNDAEDDMTNIDKAYDKQSNPYSIGGSTQNPQDARVAKDAPGVAQAKAGSL